VADKRQKSEKQTSSALLALKKVKRSIRAAEITFNLMDIILMIQETHLQVVEECYELSCSVKYRFKGL
jgi:hypothetical protein